MMKKFVFLCIVLLGTISVWAESTNKYAGKGIAIWQFYKNGNVVATVPCDSVDSVAVANKKLVKFFDSHKTTLVSKMITQVDSITLGEYINEDSIDIAEANWNWVNLGNGLLSGQAKITLDGMSQYVTIVKYPETNYTTTLVNASNPNQGTVPAIAQRYDAVAASNASFFNMTDLVPATYYFLHHSLVSLTASTSDYATRISGYVAFKDEDGHEIEIGQMDENKHDYYQQTYNSMVAAGPLLMLNSNYITPPNTTFCTERHPRTVIGYDNQGVIYLMVIDGRFPSYGANGVTITETARIARYVGMTYALNLDGGGSSTLYTKQQGVLNYPCDNNKFDHTGCRTIPSIVMVK